MELDWALPGLREGRAAPESLVERRAMMSGFPPGEPVAGVEPRLVELGGVPAVVCEPVDAAGTVLYLHGGGYRLGAAAMWTRFGSLLAAGAGVRVALLDYRLAPEEPFPAAVHDAAAAYEQLIGDEENVVVAGDSAGGGLAAALGIACLRSGVEVPRGLVLVSPWVDLTTTASTYESRRETDALFSADSAREAADQYLQGDDPHHELASPGLADLTGLPPTQVFAGGDEVLLDDAIGFASKLALANGTVEAHFVRGMQHVWPTTDMELPEARQALAAMVRFVRQVLST